MNATDFREKYGPWAVVAGASEGIGEAFSRSLAARGLNLILVARRPPLLEKLAEELRAKHGIEVRTLPLDLAREDAADQLCAAAEAVDLGLLVYNAALAPNAPFHETSVEDHLRLLAINIRSPMLLCHKLGARLMQRGRGGIILMASMAGLQGSPGVTHYAASKAYNLVLAEGLWGELGRKGVDVLACVAGSTHTPGYEMNAAPERLIAPPVMQPGPVAEEALGALGRQPSLIPGFWNRLASSVMRRFLSRKRSVVMIQKSTESLGHSKVEPTIQP